MPIPYQEHVGDRDPVVVLRESFNDYKSLVTRFTSTQWSMPWQPGKWTAQQIMVHVVQWEMIMGVRFRMAVGFDNYQIQPADQDPLMGIEDRVVDGPMAYAAFEGIRKMNLALAEALSPEQRLKKVMHPERGEIDVNNVLITLAGHGVHHYKQLKTM
jgi:hypothetical protein